uniref:Short-chain dehydrogenase/reductase ffsI n=1 Tax=Aspergillus flavipes TaxID=41900 RepID=FFSI_ASPFV|nr:RecName: Full=Short-chain dehydrogenase/reductase ffsI; AltName: Full=Cytochalasans biosynthesis cluster protein ffsI [Aspergillus flavipes]QOG08946.1 FfsI [Aspergillus flavipes]
MAEAITSVPAKSSLSAFWWASKHPPADPTTSFAGKTILITGPNAGLGYEAALKFAALGASQLIFGVRSLARGKEAKASIEAKTKCAPSVIHLLQLDMASYASIESFAREVNSKFPVVHAAVLNAGVAPPAYKRSPEGWEMALQVNVISTAYLAILLLPKLRATGIAAGEPTHLEFVTSVGHGDVAVETVRDARSILGKVNEEANFKFTAQYSITKLLEMWVMRHVAAAARSSEVIVNGACPSLCKSSLGRDFSIMLRAPDSLMKAIIGRTAEQGSRILVSAVTTGQKAHGGFWSHDRIAVPGVLVTSDEGKKLSEQFWKEILDELSKQNPDVEKLLSESS